MGYGHDTKITSFHYSSFPLWRSDDCRFVLHTHADTDKSLYSALSAGHHFSVKISQKMSHTCLWEFLHMLMHLNPSAMSSLYFRVFSHANTESYYSKPLISLDHFYVKNPQNKVHNWQIRIRNGIFFLVQVVTYIMPPWLCSVKFLFLKYLT